MGFPSFASGDILTATDMNAVGWWLVKTQTVGTGVSSVTVTGAFSSTYDNYRIIYSGYSHNTSLVWIAFQFDASRTTGYYGAAQFIDSGGVITTQGTSDLGRFLVSRSSSTTTGPTTVCEVSQPAAANRKGVYGISNGGGTVVIHGGEYQSTSTFTQFVLSPSLGTLTGGTIRVYGYRK